MPFGCPRLVMGKPAIIMQIVILLGIVGSLGAQAVEEFDDFLGPAKLAGERFEGWSPDCTPPKEPDSQTADTEDQCLENWKDASAVFVWYATDTKHCTPVLSSDNCVIVQSNPESAIVGYQERTLISSSENTTKHLGTSVDDQGRPQLIATAVGLPPFASEQSTTTEGEDLADGESTTESSLETSSEATSQEGDGPTTEGSDQSSTESPEGGDESSPSADQTPLEMSTGQAEDIVNIHNRLRGREPKRLNGMLRDARLAQSAQQWANRCILGHPSNSPYGQNVGWSSVLMSWKYVIANMWYAEKRNFVYGRDTGYVVGHYTQIVWGSTRRVGCGAARCSSGYYYVCNYYPPGNVYPDIFRPY